MTHLCAVTSKTPQAIIPASGNHRRVFLDVPVKSMFDITNSRRQLNSREKPINLVDN